MYSQRQIKSDHEKKNESVLTNSAISLSMPVKWICDLNSAIKLVINITIERHYSTFTNSIFFILYVLIQTPQKTKEMIYSHQTIVSFQVKPDRSSNTLERGALGLGERERKTFIPAWLSPSECPLGGEGAPGNLEPYGGQEL